MFSLNIMGDIHKMVRPSAPVDLYYYDADTSKHQAFPTTFNSRFYQAFTNLGGGTSTFILPPANGYTDIVCTFAITPSATGTNLALPRGWCWALIDNVQYRYGGSSTYQVSGDQLLQNAFRAQTSRTSCDDLLTLGGQFVSGADLVANVPQVGSIVLALPHSLPSGVGKKLPFPSDLLTQQILVQVSLKPVGTIFTNNTGSALPAWTQALTSASFGVAQIMLNNQGDSLARRINMASNSYAYPAEFVQNVVRVSCLANTNVQSLTLTGFRAGQVQSLEMWLTDTVGDLTTSPTNGSTTGYNPFRWILPKSLQITYAGEVFSRFENGTSPLWNLINSNKAPAFDNIDINIAGGAIVGTPIITQWVSAPFAQPLCDEDSHFIQVAGRMITNGIVNVDIALPVATALTLNVSYVYATTILMSSGSADFVF